jgi:hypothetical protein
MTGGDNFDAGPVYCTETGCNGCIAGDRKTDSNEDYLMRAKNTTGVAVATAAAMLFGTAFVGTAAAADDTVHCTGVNSCKGQSACKSASNSCKGQNSCKGKGFLELSKADCTAAKAKAKDAK